MTWHWLKEKQLSYMHILQVLNILPYKIVWEIHFISFSLDYHIERLVPINQTDIIKDVFPAVTKAGLSIPEMPLLHRKMTDNVVE